MKPPDPEIPLPPHAHVPGKTPRHAEGTFAAFHASVQKGMATDALAQTLAWRAGWHYIEAGFHWEAHEVLEPVWMALPPNAPERQFVQALIQTANAALKLDMGRPRATLRLCTIASTLLDAGGAGPAIMGLPPADVRRYLEGVREQAQGAIDARNAL